MSVNKSTIVRLLESKKASQNHIDNVLCLFEQCNKDTAKEEELYHRLAGSVKSVTQNKAVGVVQDIKESSTESAEATPVVAQKKRVRIARKSKKS